MDSIGIWLVACVGVVIIAALALWVIAIYNGLVRARNAYKNAFAQIDVQLTRRHDLIPNLVEVARGYMKHEREALEAVIAARAGAVNAGLLAASILAANDDQLSSRVERYREEQTQAVAEAPE